MSERERPYPSLSFIVGSRLPGMRKGEREGWGREGEGGDGERGEGVEGEGVEEERYREE